MLIIVPRNLFPRSFFPQFPTTNFRNRNSSFAVYYFFENKNKKHSSYNNEIQFAIEIIFYSNETTKSYLLMSNKKQDYHCSIYLTNRKYNNFLAIKGKKPI